jgi:hypothetical protein
MEADGKQVWFTYLITTEKTWINKAEVVLNIPKVDKGAYCLRLYSSDTKSGAEAGSIDIEVK